jgi:hypothetical protein
MADYLNTKLDADQVLRRAYDETSNRLRVDAEVTAQIGDINVHIDAASGDNIAIADATGTNKLVVNPDGSINTNTTITNISLSQATDSVAIGDGTNLVTVTPLRGLNVTTPDSVSSVGVLSAVNDSISIQLSGLNSAGFQINTGSFIGTLVAESSVDGGSNWTGVPFYDPLNAAILTSLVFSTANTLKIVSIIPLGGSSNVRVRVSAQTSGSATALVRASTVTGAAGAITAAAFSSITNTYISIPANTPTLLVSANVNRKYAYLSNGSASTLKIQLQSAIGLTTSTGLPIPANTYYEFRGDNLFTGNIYGVSANAITVSVTEGLP